MIDIYSLYDQIDIVLSISSDQMMIHCTSDNDEKCHYYDMENRNHLVMHKRRIHRLRKENDEY
jgi:hypothetical protein